VRDSDIIRYAVKTVLRGLSPLCDGTINGRNLVPVLVESGDELIRYFELDAYRLDTIINAQAEVATRVDRDDIALLAMSGMREQYLVMRMKDGHAAPQEEAPSGPSLRNYLYEKYIYRNEEPHPVASPARPPEAEVRLGQLSVA
jgi:hypothetical protein